jgi:two-component system, OmpR family, sensor kinase
MTRRWRPSLAMVLGGALAGTLGLSFAGLVALRYLGPEVGYRNGALMLAVAITAATALLGWLLVRLLLRPIHGLEVYARALENAAAPAPPLHFGTRELHASATRVIAMAQVLRSRETTIRAYTDHVTHELKTPLSAIRAAVELLIDGGSLTNEDRRLVGDIDGACQQVEAQLAALRVAAQAREVRYLGHATLADVVPALRLDRPDLTLKVEGGDVPLPLSAEGVQIVLGHLLRNAAEHGAQGVRLQAVAEPHRVQVIVQDDGAGISPGNAGRIFEPFFTTRRSDGGTGMGLSVVRNILLAHRGDIGFEPVARDGAATGACFRLTFAAPDA